MDCKQCIEDLTAYLDGELSQSNSAQIRSHVAMCNTCASELRELQEAADFVDSHKHELDLKPGSWNAVRAGISAEKPPALFRLPELHRWRMALAALACVAMLAFGYLWYQQVQERSLDAYISEYVKAREASQIYRPAITGMDDGSNYGNLASDNPFIEIKASSDLNPFRSEDR
jgi:hypothetical protein